MKIKKLKNIIGNGIYQFFKANFEDYINFTYQNTSATKSDWIKEGPKVFIKDGWDNTPPNIQSITKWYYQHKTVKANRKINQDRLRPLGMVGEQSDHLLVDGILEKLHNASIRAEEFKTSITSTNKLTDPTEILISKITKAISEYENNKINK